MKSAYHPRFKEKDAADINLKTVFPALWGKKPLSSKDNGT